ncbi:MAG TPA: dimethylsulfonioproprionate lyase family protein [Caldilineaceae bacterium]|nr:dimethylsulfonioproprionate lyase family protein [Caldilineaceae bacterium]
MLAFELAELEAQSRRHTDLYMEFLKQPAMSAGLYRLAAGATDPQHPHSEDEVYYVVSGRAQIRIEGEDRPVGPGSLVYVPAHAEHRFHSIDQELVVLVFFAPAEGSRSAAG